MTFVCAVVFSLFCGSWVAVKYTRDGMDFVPASFFGIVVMVIVFSALAYYV